MCGSYYRYLGGPNNEQSAIAYPVSFVVHADYFHLHLSSTFSMQGQDNALRAATMLPLNIGIPAVIALMSSMIQCYLRLEINLRLTLCPLPGVFSLAITK